MNSEDIDTKFCPKSNEFFTTVVAFWMHYMLNILSKHLAVALDVSYRYTGVYLSKFYSCRCLATFLGAILKDILERNFKTDIKIISFTSLILMLISRFVYLIFLYTSLHPAEDIYKIVAIEAFFFGYFQMTLFTLQSNYYHHKPMTVHGSGIIILFFQCILEMCCRNRPMLIIKFHSWICFLLTLASTVSWYWYLFYKHDDVLKAVKACEQKLSDPGTNKFECQNFKKYKYRDTFLYRPKLKPGFKGHLRKILCAFTMLLSSTLFKDILYPGIIPYTLLDRDKCHSINMLMPLFYLPGASGIYALNKWFDQLTSKKCFEKFEWYFHFMYVLIIPQIIIFIKCFLAIHTEIPEYKRILNSVSKVMFMAFGLEFCYSILEYTSYIAVANYVYKVSKDIKDSIVVLTYHNIFTWFLRYVSARLAVGYNAARLDYEYSISVYHPTYMMSNFEAVLFWCKDTVKRAYVDAKTDLDLNISQFL